MEELNTTSLACVSAKSGRKHRGLVVLALPLLVVALLWTTQAAPANGVVGALRLRRPAVLQTPPPDPVAFVAELEPVMPKPVALLTVGDAVAHELLLQSHSLSEADALRTASVLVSESLAVGYDPLMVLALIYVESYFDHFAISPVGAEGLMQIMPETGQWMAQQMGLERTLGHTFDPTLNVRLGTRYLAQLQRQFGGNLECALTAYNRGPAATSYILHHYDGHLPEDIRDAYSTKVLKRYHELRAAYGALPVS